MLQGVSAPRTHFFDWFTAGFRGNFSVRLPMCALFHREATIAVPVIGPVHADVPELHAAELAAVYYGQRIAGDFYDFLRVGPDRVLFGLLDVAGGLEDTRAIVSAAQSTFRSVGSELFSRPEVNEADAMMELCLQLNQAVLNAADGVRSCPAFAGCYNESMGVICYFNAGHTPGLLRDHAGVSELPATGLPLGLFSHLTTDAAMVALEPGSVLLLASRGIVDAKSKSDEFGLQRVQEVLQQFQSGNASELCVAVLNQVMQFMGGAPTHNDVTALALARTPDPSK
jgi:serine phosphatase RsbU (regulator of sigma subunit)